MNIRIDAHTAARAIERGTTDDEIREVLETGTPLPARRGRRRKIKTFPFEQERFGRRYAQKRVEVNYVKEQQTVVTVTVYVFFGDWKDRT
jgi:hypothetical protein